jgi:hypothetical protein
MKTIPCCSNNYVLKIAGSLLLIAALVLPITVTSCQEVGADFTIELLGTPHVFQLDSKDRFQSRVEISSADGNVTLTIEKGTRFVDSNGNQVYAIQCEIEPYPPWPREGSQMMGPVYSFSPEGVTCDPPLEVVMSYDPQELSLEFTGEEISIASYEVFICTCGGTYAWYGTSGNEVNPASHLVSAQIDTLDNYVLLAAREGMVVPPKINISK